MENRNEPARVETGSERSTSRRWLALGGLAVAAVAVMLCLAAAAGIGGLLWLSSARQANEAAITAPATPVPVAPSDASTAEALPAESEIAPTAARALPISGDPINRIVLVDPAGRLATIAPDGADSRILTGAGARYQFPAWSPDSSRIAAVGIDGSEGGVYMWPDQANAQRDTLFASSVRPPIYLYWSPDSAQVSFLANDRSSLGLWLAEANGVSAARQIASGQPFYWDWSRSGDQLFVHAGGLGPDAQLAWLDAGADWTGTNVATPGLFQAPGISADGRSLAFGQVENERFLVTVEDRSSGQRTAIPHTGLVALGWSPAAPLLAWTSPRSDQLTSAGPLRLLEVETGETTTLVQDTVFAFFWSPDGRYIAYLTLGGGADNPGAAKPAGLAALSEAQPAQRNRPSLRLGVVDVASGQQRWLSTFRPSPIFLSQFLPFFDQYALSHRLWSPASDALVLPMMDDSGNSEIYVVSVESGEATRVAAGTMAFWSWR